MILHLLRHGEAQPSAPIDSQRELTTQGQDDLEQVLARRKDQIERPDSIWVSPYTRTQQTAYCVKSVFSWPDALFELNNQVIPSSKPSLFIERLERLDIKHLFVITHQPFIGDLLNQLCDFEPGRYQLGTSSLLQISFDFFGVGCGELDWIEKPHS